MRVEVSPVRSTVSAGTPVVLTVQIFNRADIISAQRVRVLGVDPSWVSVTPERLSLFPDSTGTVLVTVTLPTGMPAGTRRIGIEICETTPPAQRELVAAELTIAARREVKVQLDPPSTTGGRSAAFGVLMENSGNAEVTLCLSAVDEEAAATFTFLPPLLVLAPGDRATSDLTVRARRRLTGSPRVRVLTIAASGADIGTGADRGGGPRAETVGTFVQRPVLSRGMLGLVGLLAAVAVFAAVLTVALSRVVDKSTADRQLALQVATASRTSAAGTARVKGTVTLLTSGAPVPGVTVDVFNSANTAQSLASVATDSAGGYVLGGLSSGTYKVRIRGAGFAELWYPASLTADNATAVTVSGGQAVPSIDVRLGGVPGSIAGTVAGGDPTGAVVKLEVAGSGAGSSAPPPADAPPPAGSAGPADAPGSAAGAVVAAVAVDAGGAFTLTKVPSPATYDLVLTKPGFVTSTQEVSLGGGEERSGVSMTLRQGDGTITGHVVTSAGPLGGATVTASSGPTTVKTISVTQDDVGSFTLANLPTPASFSVAVKAPGYAEQSLTLVLGPAQQLSGVVATLVPGVGSIGGTVSVAGGTPAGGVGVTVTNGSVTVRAMSVSVGRLGTYRVDGLQLPGAYTVTFSRPDLTSLTTSVNLDPVAKPRDLSVNATLGPATATVKGTVTSQGVPVGEITVAVTSGSTAYRVVTSSVPAPGAYVIEGIQPGTYTVSFTRAGATPTSLIEVLAAGQTLTLSPALAPVASISGMVDGAGSLPLPGAQVRLYLAGQYPATVLASVLTRADGTFSFANLDAPRDYVIEFAASAGAAGQRSLSASVKPSDKIVVPTVSLKAG